MTLRELELTESLSSDLKKLIKDSFDNILATIGEEEFLYVGEKFEKKISAVEASRTSWIRDLSSGMTSLYELLEAHSQGEAPLSDAAVVVVGAALFYFVNPYDVIPDHIPATGYLDDAYVYNLCVKRLRRLAPEYVE